MRKKLLVALVVTMALLAGCTGGGSQSATDDSPASATAGDAPQNIKTFHIQTERGKYFCIYTEHTSGYSGYRGLSCDYVGKGA